MNSKRNFKTKLDTEKVGKAPWEAGMGTKEPRIADICK